MITLKDFLERIDYKITEGSQYCWKCFGEDVYQIDSWNGKHGGDGGHSVHAIFDTKTQFVYEVQAWDYDNQRYYRWISPDFVDVVKAESATRGVDFGDSCDGLQFIDLDVEDDIMEKVKAIANDLPYDTRCQITLDLPDEMIFTLMKLAHEADVTFNAYIEQILVEAIERVKPGALAGCGNGCLGCKCTVEDGE
jgi:hypothetical protein